MTDRDRDELHPWATEEGQRRAEVIESAAEAVRALNDRKPQDEPPVAPNESPRTYLCHGCGKYFHATAYAKHIVECGQEVQAGPVPWDEHDEARVSRTGAYQERIERENQRRFGNPLGPKGGK